MKIRETVAGNGECCGIEGDAVGIDRINAGGVIDEVGIKPGFFDLFGSQVACKLVDDGAHHFQMRQFLCTYRSNGNVPIY